MYSYSFISARGNAIRICQRQSEVGADGTETEGDALCNTIIVNKRAHPYCSSVGKGPIEQTVIIGGLESNEPDLICKTNMDRS